MLVWCGCTQRKRWRITFDNTPFTRLYRIPRLLSSAVTYTQVWVNYRLHSFSHRVTKHPWGVSQFGRERAISSSEKRVDPCGCIPEKVFATSLGWSNTEPKMNTSFFHFRNTLFVLGRRLNIKYKFNEIPRQYIKNPYLLMYSFKLIILTTKILKNLRFEASVRPGVISTVKHTRETGHS